MTTKTTEPFSASYLAGEARALRLLPADFRDAAARAQVARARAARQTAPALLGEIEAQAAAAGGLRPAQAAHLSALSRPGAAAVLSGQQVGLFSGPLYTIYKAASAIVTARRLSQEAGLPCAPIFWLQTEDHDFAEIAACHLLRPGQAPLRLAVSAEGPERASVADRRLSADVLAALGAAEEALAGLPHAVEVLSLLRAAYVPGRSPGAAFAAFLSSIFADEGLLILDPRRPQIAQLAAPIYRRALCEHGAIEEALRRRGEALRAAGFDEQVHPRPGATLLFFHLGGAPNGPPAGQPAGQSAGQSAGPVGAAGPRYRIERRGAGFALAGAPLEQQAISEVELLTALEREPLRLSTSALLRPLVQDALLPTALYLGGPGELNYLAQLPPLYAHLDLPPPLFAPRARFRCTEDNTRALLAKLGLCAADAERPRDELRRRCGAEAGEHPAPDALREELLFDVSARLARLGAFDPSLREPAQQAQQSIERTLQKLVERYGRALLERDRVTTERVDRLRSFLFPDEQPQERVGSVLYFLARHGIEGYRARLLGAVEPFSAAVRELPL